MVYLHSKKKGPLTHASCAISATSLSTRTSHYIPMKPQVCIAKAVSDTDFLVTRSFSNTS